MKILFNNCYGGFGISKKARQIYNERKNTNYQFDYELECYNARIDEVLIQIVEELGVEANGDCAELGIAEIPDGAYWHVEEYDGAETIIYTLVPPPEEFSAKILKVYEEKEEEE